MDNFATLRDIRSARSVGLAHLAVRSRVALHVEQSDPMTAADKLCTTMGLRALGADWIEIRRTCAAAVLASVLHRDLAYSAEIMPEANAQLLASAFLAFFPDNASYLTNRKVGLDQHDALREAWTPITAATFDTGVVVVDRERVGIAWFEDED